MNRIIDHFRFQLLSALIAGILLFQLFTGFKHTNNWFPFMWYPMYGFPNFEGDRIMVRHSIYVVRPNGQRRYLHPDRDLKMGFWRYDSLAKHLARNDLEKVREGLIVIKSLQPDLVEVQIEDFPMIITKDGPKPAPKKVLNAVDRKAVDRWAT